MDGRVRSLLNRPGSMARAADKKNRSRVASGNASTSRKGTGKADAAPKAGEREERVLPERWTSAWLVDWAKTLVFALVIFLVLRSFVLASFVIDSGSMENTLLVGDFLLVNKVVLGSPIPGTALRIPGWRPEPQRHRRVSSGPRARTGYREANRGCSRRHGWDDRRGAAGERCIAGGALAATR